MKKVKVEFMFVILMEMSRNIKRYCIFYGKFRMIGIECKGGDVVRKITNFFFSSLLILIFLNGCNSNQVSEDMFKFKDSYVGENGAVGNIVRQLPYSEYLNGFELKTKEEPYGIILSYKDLEVKETEKNYKETAIYNATFIFTLVKNAEWVTFNFDDQAYKITKDDLENWYGKEFSKYSSEEDLTKLIQNYLEDESKVNHFFEE